MARPRLAVSLWEDALTRSLGTKALHLGKRDVEGNSETELPLRGIVTSTDRGTFTIPPGEIDRVREFLATCDYDPGVARIPLKKLQELRGN